MSDAKAESVARVLEGIAAPAVEPITAIWTDAKLRGIASDYFPDAKDWPAAMLCLRHLLMEQASAKPVVEPVQSADIERIRHVANEWADMAANLLQGLRNISDGISNVDEVLALAEENLAHCQEVNDAAFSGAIGASARELATSAQQSAEPVAGWFESPHGAFRANPNYKHAFPAKSLTWQIPLYTHPPQRKPVPPEQTTQTTGAAALPPELTTGAGSKPEPLTDAQIDQIAATPCAIVGSYVHTFARAIERAHGIGATEPGGAA